MSLSRRVYGRAFEAWALKRKRCDAPIQRVLIWRNRLGNRAGWCWGSGLDGMIGIGGGGGGGTGDARRVSGRRDGSLGGFG